MQATSTYAARPQPLHAIDSRLALVTDATTRKTDVFYRSSFSAPSHGYHTRRQPMTAYFLETKITLEDPGFDTGSNRVGARQITEALDQTISNTLSSLESYTDRQSIMQNIADIVADYEYEDFDAENIEVSQQAVSFQAPNLTVLPPLQSQYIQIDLPTHLSFEFDRAARTTKVFYETMFQDLRQTERVLDFSISTTVYPRTDFVELSSLQQELDFYTVQAARHVTATNNAYEAITTQLASSPLQLCRLGESEYLELVERFHN